MSPGPKAIVASIAFLCAALLSLPSANATKDPVAEVDGAGVSAFGSSERQSQGSQRAKDAQIELADGPAVNLVLQAVVGAWPLERDRAVDYAMKAVREASVSTAWVDGDEDFERELTRFIDFLFTNPRARGVVEGCVARVSEPGWANALAATALQLTLPGVPDVYQGQELWEPSLVDPDNRRPVDFTARDAMLTELDAAAPGSAFARSSSASHADGARGASAFHRAGGTR